MPSLIIRNLNYDPGIPVLEEILFGSFFNFGGKVEYCAKSLYIIFDHYVNSIVEFKMADLVAKQSEEYFTKLFNRNCEILKRFELMIDTVKKVKKREINECTQCLKKWKASSAKHALEACTKTFMENINAVEDKVIVRSEIEKSQNIIVESGLLYKIMTKGLLHNQKKVTTLRNTFLKKDDRKQDPIDNFFVSEKKGSLVFERLNELMKTSKQNEKEMKKLMEIKEQLLEKNSVKKSY